MNAPPVQLPPVQLQSSADSPPLPVGKPVPAFSATSLRHGVISVPGGRLIHLQFRRFAGCPICSLHLRSFARRHDELQEKGVLVIALFHSSIEALRRYHVDLPFPVVGDPERILYAAYGVERSVSAMIHPRALWAAMRGMTSAPNNPLDMAGGPLGKPADFLIEPGGALRAVKYGTHADDHWEVQDVLDLC